MKTERKSNQGGQRFREIRQYTHRCWLLNTSPTHTAARQYGGNSWWSYKDNVAEAYVTFLNESHFAVRAPVRVWVAPIHLGRLREDLAELFVVHKSGYFYDAHPAKPKKGN